MNNKIQFKPEIDVNNFQRLGFSVDYTEISIKQYIPLNPFDFLYASLAENSVYSVTWSGVDMRKYENSDSAAIVSWNWLMGIKSRSSVYKLEKWKQHFLWISDATESQNMSFYEFPFICFMQRI